MWTTRTENGTKNVSHEERVCNAHFEIEPYQPPRSSLFYVDTSADKFFVRIGFSKNTKRDIQSAYDKKSELRPGSLVKIKDDPTESFHLEHSGKGEAIAMAMTNALSGNFATVVKQDKGRTNNNNNNKWLVETNDSNPKKRIVPRSNLAAGGTECVFSFPTVPYDHLVDSVRYMWPYHVGRENVVILVDGEPILDNRVKATTSTIVSTTVSAIKSSDLVNGKITVRLHDGILIRFANETGYKQKNFVNEIVAKVVVTAVTGLQIVAGASCFFCLVVLPVYFVFFS